MKNPSKSNPTAVIIIVAIIIAAFIGFFMIMTPPAPEQTLVEETVTPDAAVATGGIELGTAPYELAGTTGEAITEKSFPDKYKLIYFGFTRCPDVCPLGLSNITAAMMALGVDADKIQPVFITVDPVYDTAQVMKDYLYNYDKRFVGATGTPEQIKTAQDSYRVFASQAATPEAVEATTEEQMQPAPPSDHTAHGDHATATPGMINHSDYIYFMSKDGKLLNVFPGNTDGQSISANIQTALAAEMLPPAGSTMPSAPVDVIAPVEPAAPITGEPATPETTTHQ